MKPTKLFFAFLLCTLCSLRLWATGIDIGNDRIVIVGTTVGIHANITINGLRDEEFPIKWYKRTYNETNYTLFAEGTGATDVTLSPTETTYVKATVTDAVQVFCEDVLVLIVPSVTVAEVSFLNTQGNVRQDPTPSNNAPDYFTAPHWNSSDNPTLKNPVLYKGNDKIKLSFKLNLIANGSEQPLTPSTLMSDFVQNIRIKCNAGIQGQSPIYLFPSTSVTQNGSILESATDVEASTAFAAQVGFYDPMAFAWIISYTAGTSWETNPISTTLNRVYVTATLPILDATQRYLTTVHLSCKNAATYSTPEDIVTHIYTEFQDRDVRKVDVPEAVAMKYWGNPALYIPPYPEPGQPLQVIETNTHNLLKWQDGRCGSWMNLFIDMLRVQGINKQNGTEIGYRHISAQRTADMGLDNTSTTGLLTNIGENWIGMPAYLIGKIKAPNNPDKVRAFFHVKEWEVNSTSVGKFYFSTDATGNGNTDNNGFNDDIWNDENNSILADGLPSQGFSNPYSYFSDHSIVRYNGKYYDPSYGTGPFDSFAAWQLASIEGFGATVCILNAPGESCGIDASDKYLWFEKLNENETMYEKEENNP